MKTTDILVASKVETGSPLTRGIQMPSWHFKESRPGDTTREPIQGEFFATEAIPNSAAALVREGIQNSLDARWNCQCVRVEIRVSGTEQAADAEAVAPFLDGAWPHWEAKPNGLRDVPSRQDHCQFLTFEDFGTSGLDGHPRQWHPQDDVQNAFFNFFRAEGHSDKGGTDRGRWGIGKTVFPRASRISTFWGVTVRASDTRRLLMGRTILKSHQNDGIRYVPDGYFGNTTTEGGILPPTEGLILPLENSDLIDRFSQVFALRRGAEPGLSLVVPWYDETELTLDNLLQAVVEGYFFPILAGDLQVTVMGPDGAPRQLTAETLLETVRRVNGPLATSMMPLLELAVWAQETVKGPFPELNRPAAQGALRWSADLIPTDTLKQIRQKLQAGERIAVRVPMPVREKGKETKWSFFDVFLVRDGTEERGRPKRGRALKALGDLGD